MRYSETERKKRGKRKKKHYFLNVSIAILVILGLWFLGFRSGVFDIHRLDVQNNVHYTAAQAAELTGVSIGDNIFRTRVSEVEERLEKDPYIRSAEVEWDLPDGLAIVLEERTENILIEYAEGYIILDFDGEILRLTQEAPILPIIVGLTPIGPAPGTPMKAEEAGQLKPGLDFFKFASEHDFYIKKLDLGSVIPRAYVFDRLVIEGDLGNIEKGMNEIKRVIADLDSKGIERGTLSVGGNGTCSFTPELR
ncbi:MAG: FtsQ-type POTRA domain-containing protein [Clostridiales Family XIII bacterium]|jgi:cell division protein FtsQ|nr:FtsQ-type POTRA domain-containing protein [Clostridiales Family XIII bacterium]